MTSKELITNAELTAHKDKWLTGKELCSMIASKTNNMIDMSTIELRSIIQNLRAMGKPIIASEKGYKYTESIKDIGDYCSNRRIEIQKELTILSAMEITRENLLKGIK